MKNLRKLSRGAMKSVNGGVGSLCALKITLTNGTTEVHTQYFPGSNSQASSGANSACVSILQDSSVTRCKYDCAYDGFGK
ncbi:hypothetical protein [uncultured Chryseobacterium sp.]|jgi:hypothetical protein|uniref:bacteriocin-like protein n=1 Tax=uncultured Chryseobacterium sp. TaxID=259322 RepID=UPI00261492B0|nr:hypothetical protein [uncultured Chryseobacterium sp.]